jgi:hypothetical protein
LINAGVAAASLAVTYLVIQFVFFRFMLADLPPNLRPYLSDRARVFAQTSAAHEIPHDYVALLGDSYGEGVGDWMLAAGGEKKRPFGSADVIHAQTGRDIVTFARAGASSADAMVLRVAHDLRGGDCYAFPSVGEPKRFVVYFYEGNDLDDNNALIESAALPRGAGLAAAIDDFFDHTYGVESRWRCYYHLAEMVDRMARFVAREGLRRPIYIDLPESRNRILVAGMPTPTPALQVPSMALDDGVMADGITVFDRSLAWLRRHYPAAPATVIYIPSPAAIYRHAIPEVVSRDVYDLDGAKARRGRPPRGPDIRGGAGLCPQPAHLRSRPGGQPEERCRLRRRAPGIARRRNPSDRARPTRLATRQRNRVPHHRRFGRKAYRRPAGRRLRRSLAGMTARRAASRQLWDEKHGAALAG